MINADMYMVDKLNETSGDIKSLKDSQISCKMENSAKPNIEDFHYPEY